MRGERMSSRSNCSGVASVLSLILPTEPEFILQISVFCSDKYKLELRCHDARACEHGAGTRTVYGRIHLGHAHRANFENITQTSF